MSKGEKNFKYMTFDDEDLDSDETEDLEEEMEEEVEAEKEEDLEEEMEEEVEAEKEEDLEEEMEEEVEGDENEYSTDSHSPSKHKLGNIFKEKSGSVKKYLGVRARN